MNLPLPDDASVRRPRVHRSPARLTVCVLLLLGILAEMVMIFLFSNEDKTQSGDRSDKVTEAIAPVVVPGYEKLPAEEQTEIVERLGMPVRKLAHMTEYAVLAILLGALPSAGLCRLCSACCMPPLTKFIRYSRTGARPCWTS